MTVPFSSAKCSVKRNIRKDLFHSVLKTSENGPSPNAVPFCSVPDRSVLKKQKNGTLRDAVPFRSVTFRSVPFKIQKNTEHVELLFSSVPFCSVPFWNSKEYGTFWIVVPFRSVPFRFWNRKKRNTFNRWFRFGPFRSVLETAENGTLPNVVPFRSFLEIAQNGILKIAVPLSSVFINKNSADQ